MNVMTNCNHFFRIKSFGKFATVLCYCFVAGQISSLKLNVIPRFMNVFKNVFH